MPLINKKESGILQCVFHPSKSKRKSNGLLARGFPSVHFI